MVLKILKTLFFALGLAMVWLAIFFNYRLNEQPDSNEIATSPASSQMETYTLSNDSYSEKSIREMEFRNMDSEENALIFRLGDFPETETEVDPESDRINTGSFAGEFDALETAAEKNDKPVAGKLPFLLAFGGVVFLCFGFFSFKMEQQKKQTV